MRREFQEYVGPESCSPSHTDSTVVISLCSVGGHGRGGRGCRVFWGPPQPPGNFHCSHGWGSLYTAPPIRGQELRASGESVSLGWGALTSLCSRGSDILAAI